MVTRRPDLPGVDTLFGGTKPAQPAAQSAQRPDTPVTDTPVAAPVTPQPAAREVGGIDEAMRAGAFTAVCEPSPAIRRAAAEASTVLHPPGDDVGAFLRFMVASRAARTVVEVGGAGGVSGLWMLAAGVDGLTVTSIEPDEHVHKLAKQAYRDAGVAGQVRAIHAEGQTVLPRLADASYDLVVLQAGAAKLDGDLAEAVRILRPGGVLIARGVLRGGAHAKANAQFVTHLAEHRALTVSVLTIDDGVVVAAKTA